ncbi:hypothetical protein GGI07_001344 [Coemansia sp. Benny D115]|nr:hypothetical protein GGI07_001344 [Coemansia sp. Benny D115]
MISADDPSLISSYELVTRSLEDSIKYDNLSDAEKSRARKHRHVSKRRRTLRQQCLAAARSIDLFWALTAASIGSFVLIALSLLYLRHSRQVFQHRFSHEEISQRRLRLGFDHVYVVERLNNHGAAWTESGRQLQIDFERWPVAAPSPVDPLQTRLEQRECWRAHQAIHRDMVARGFMDALVVEAHVVPGASPQLRLYSALAAIPADWDVLQLGPTANGTDSGRHDDIPIHGPGGLAYRRVEDGACNNLAYAISRAGARKLLRVADETQAHADFEHRVSDMLQRAKLLVFRVTPAVFAWEQSTL